MFTQYWRLIDMRNQHPVSPVAFADWHHAMLITNELKRDPQYLTKLYNKAKELKIFPHQNYYTDIKNKIEKIMQTNTTREEHSLEKELTPKINAVLRAS